MPIDTETIWSCDLKGCPNVARTDAERQGWVETPGVAIFGGPAFMAVPPRKFVFCTSAHAIESLESLLLAANAGR